MFLDGQYYYKPANKRYHAISLNNVQKATHLALRYKTRQEQLHYAFSNRIALFFMQTEATIFMTQ